MQYVRNAYKNFLFQIGTNTTNARDASAIEPPAKMPSLAAVSAVSRIEAIIQKRTEARHYCILNFNNQDQKIQIIEKNFTRRLLAAALAYEMSPQILALQKAKLRALHAEAGLQNAEGREQRIRLYAQKAEERAQKAVVELECLEIQLVQKNEEIQKLKEALAEEKQAREAAQQVAQHAQAHIQVAEARAQQAVLRAQQAVLRAQHAEALAQQAGVQHAVLAPSQRNREETDLISELS